MAKKIRDIARQLLLKYMTRTYSPKLLFSNAGFSYEDISSFMGVNRTTVYRYFTPVARNALQHEKYL